MHQAGSDALLTNAVFFKVKKAYMKNISDQKYINILDGIPPHSDDVWRKAMVSEYPYMMFGSYGMHNMQMMDNSYYPQNEAMYSNVANNPYKMHYYQNYGTNVYQDQSQKPKNYDNQGGKSKKQSKN